MRVDTLLPALALLSVSSVHHAAGQSVGDDPIVVELHGSTRALAMGGAAVLDGLSPASVFYNPAAIYRASGAGFGLQRFGSAATLASFAAGTGWASGGVVLAFKHLSYGALSVDPLFGPEIQSDLLISGPVGASELVGAVGYARELFGFNVGIAGKLVEQRVGATAGATGALDLGVLTDIDDVVLGVSVRNIGPGLDGDGSRRPLPTEVTVGASLASQQLGPLDLIATAAVTRRRDQEIVPAGGLEISYWPISGRTLTGRMGLSRVPTDSRSPFTFGAGFTGDELTIEYSYQGFDGPGGSHRIGLRWR